MGTNNTAELNALYHALRMAEAEIGIGNSVEICSDSAYSINCIRSWAPGWEKRGWKKPGGEIKNLKIIQDCYAIYQRIEAQLNLTHVAAHVGTEGNELADRMAMLAVQRKEKQTAPVSGTNGHSDAAQAAGGMMTNDCVSKSIRQPNTYNCLVRN
jgi:ribonuclease HI